MFRKKVLTFVTVLSMLAALFQNAAVFAKASGWELKYTGEEKTNRNKYYARIIDTNSCNGSSSLKIAYPDAEISGTYAEIIKELPEGMTDGNYNFSLNYKLGKGTKKTGIKFVIGEKEISMSDSSLTDESTTGDSKETGWKNLSGVVNYKAVEDAKFIIKVTGDITGCFIDDISLKASASEENLISGGDFEGVTLTEASTAPTPGEDPDPTPGGDPDPTPGTDPNPGTTLEPEPEPDGEKKYIDELSPQRVVIQSSNLAVALTWYNPKKSNISKVSLYEIVDNENVLLSNTLSTASGARQEYRKENLTLDDIHNYKIVNEYSDGSAREFYVNSIVKTSNGDLYTNLGQSWGRLGIDVASATYDTMTKHSGNASLKFTSNILTPKTNYYAGFRQTCSQLDKDKDYELTFWIKANEMQQFLVEMNWALSGFDQSGDVADAKGSTGGMWKKITLTKTKEEAVSGPLMFIFNHSAEFWIDDIVLREKKADGSYGKNMIADGDFESFSDSVVLDKVSNIKTYGYDNEVELSWDMPDSEKCTEVRIYEKIGNAWASRGTVNAAQNSVRFEHMTADTDYTFKICPLNSLNKEGEGTDVTVHTVLPDYVIDDPILYNSQNKQHSGALSAGTYKIVSPVKNNKIDLNGGLKLEAFAGVFKENKLIKLYSASATVAKKEKTESPEKIEISGIVIDQDLGECEIRVFWIDSRATQNALRGSVKF